MSDREAALFRVRAATIADASLLARHRAAMFRDMGQLSADLEPALVRATADYLHDAMPRGEYLGWVAESTVPTGACIGGAGVQLRPILPRRARQAAGSSSAPRRSFSMCMWSRRGGDAEWAKR